MKSKSEIGQKIRAVQKFNRCVERSFRHCFPGERLSNMKAFLRHAGQARKIARKYDLTIFDFTDLPAKNPPHVEPGY